MLLLFYKMPLRCFSDSARTNKFTKTKKLMTDDLRTAAAVIRARHFTVMSVNALSCSQKREKAMRKPCSKAPHNLFPVRQKGYIENSVTQLSSLYGIRYSFLSNTPRNLEQRCVTAFPYSEHSTDDHHDKDQDDALDRCPALLPDQEEHQQCDQQRQKAWKDHIQIRLDHDRVFPVLDDHTECCSSAIVGDQGTDDEYTEDRCRMGEFMGIFRHCRDCVHAEVVC